MNPIYFMSRAINVLDVIDHTTKPLTTEAYLDALGDDGMMLEAVTLEEVEATYLYGLDTDERMMLEAITTTKNRIDKTMAAFVRSLNQQLNSSGLEAYQAEIGKPAKSGQVAVMTARIPLSDGQSISVVFHSPSGDPGKIVANDDLVAFRFLLNKRDVTHVVAPSGGQDISLKQTCLTLSNLAERNSAKFQSKQAETKAKEAELATLQASTEQLQAEAADVIEKADQLTERAAADSQKEAEIKAKLDKQVAKNEELRRQLAGMGGEPAPSQTAKPEPEPTPEQGKITNSNTDPASLSAELSALESDPNVTLQAVKAFHDKLDKLFNNAGIAIGEWSPLESRVTKLEASLLPPTDTIRKVKQDLRSFGKATLTNGAELAYTSRNEEGELEGYVTLTEPGGKSYVLKSPSSQGGPMEDTAHKLYKAYREGKAEKYLGTVPATPEAATPEPVVSEPEAAPAAVDDEPSPPVPESAPAEQNQPPLYWYGLRNRPLSLGAQPKGSVAYIAPEEAVTDPRIAPMVATAGEASVRHGAIAYDRELTPEEVASYELVDFGRMAAAWDETRRANALVELKGVINTLLEGGDDAEAIWNDLITPNGSIVTNSPFYDWDEEKYRGDELTKALQEAGYSGTVKKMVNELIEQQWAAIEQANKSPEELEEERREKARQDGIAALNELTKGATVPAGWTMEVDLAFGDRAALFVDSPDLPNGEEHEGYLVTANANDAGELDGTFNLTTGNGDPLSDGHTKWSEISKAMQADYQKDEAAAQPPVVDTAPAVDPAPEDPPAGATTPAENQWGETDPDVLALLQQAEELRTTETNPERYLSELQRIGGELDKAGAVERHEPYLHTVSDRLTELMEAEGV